MSCETGAEELADNQMNIYHALFTKKNLGYNNKYILVLDACVKHSRSSDNLHIEVVIT